MITLRERVEGFLLAMVCMGLIMWGLTYIAHKVIDRYGPHPIKVQMIVRAA